jgi:hypothetical protein
MAVAVVDVAQQKAKIELSANEKYIFTQWVLAGGDINPQQASDILAGDSDDQSAGESLALLIRMMSEQLHWKPTTQDDYGLEPASQKNSYSRKVVDLTVQVPADSVADQLYWNSEAEAYEIRPASQKNSDSLTDYEYLSAVSKEELNSVLSRVDKWSEKPDSQEMKSIVGSIAAGLNLPLPASFAEDRDSTPGNSPDSSTPV